jgi:tRNA(Arg) A34 adenosine deaminase TadA
MEHRFEIQLPDWVGPFMHRHGGSVTSASQAMELAIALSAENVRQGTGGPFGAVVADLDSGEVAGVGVNLVTGSGYSAAHAEIVALSLAQRLEGGFDLARNRTLTLATSCEPCAMCFGAVPWSGVRGLLCGARKADAEAAGFDEGDKPQDWVEALISRGISVQCDLLRDQAAAVFGQYLASGGEVYNPDGDGE